MSRCRLLSPLEERRVSHFIITALSDPNHRQNASIQYQHLKQSSTHPFDYWLSVLRSLPTTNPTLPLGLHHANLTSNQPRTYPEPNASSNPKSPADNNIDSDSSYHSTTCSHCGRYGHLSKHCFHNPASTSDNHNSRTNKYESPYMNRRSQSPNTPRHSSSYPKHNSPSRSPSFTPPVPIPILNALSTPANHLPTRDTEITLQDTTTPPIWTNPALNTKQEISPKRYMPISRHTNPIKIKIFSIIQPASFLKNILATELPITTLPLRINHSLTGSENIQLHKLCTIFRYSNFSINRNHWQFDHRS